MATNVEYPEKVISSIADHIESILRLLGEDPSREGLAKTPVRAAKALYYLTDGMRHDDSEAVGDALFTADGHNMIVVRDIEFYSMCEHHILPFFGHISVGYIPGDHIIGLSKLARLVNLYARRLQVQERLTAQVVEAVCKATGAMGVIAVARAEHLCMKMRGVEDQSSSTVTTDYCGLFANDAALRSEFLGAIR